MMHLRLNWRLLLVQIFKFYLQISRHDKICNQASRSWLLQIFMSPHRDIFSNYVNEIYLIE
ncbi:unnamed protein product [Nezara viridula]|uniref:Neuropeptide n=1 Tax=Nezara viridula TaxID=85310 RepID=A0A9P0H9T6_NEZVI|nr:unnamed protein product [Nezara viridula]